MKYLALVCWVASALGLAAVVGGLAYQSTMAANAKQTQLVRVTATDELFGGPGYEPIGSPQEMVVDSSQATLDKKGPNGEILLDKEKLEKLKIYPVQMQTVRFIAGLSLVVGAACAAIFGGLAILITRRSKKAVTTEPET